MKTCIFCEQNIINTVLVKEFDGFYLLVNRYPYNKQDEHYLLVPKEHRLTLSSLSAVEYQEYQILFKKMVTAIERMSDDYRWWSNQGEKALQTLEHFHVHFKAFHTKDDRSIDRVELSDQEIAQWADTIRQALDK